VGIGKRGCNRKKDEKCRECSMAHLELQRNELDEFSYPRTALSRSDFGVQPHGFFAMKNENASEPLLVRDIFPFSLFFEIKNPDQAFRRLRNANVILAVTSLCSVPFVIYTAVTERQARYAFIALAALYAFLAWWAYATAIDLNREHKCTKRTLGAFVLFFAISGAAGILYSLVFVVRPNTKFGPGFGPGIWSPPLSNQLSSVCGAIVLFYLVWRFVRRCGKFI
jgi:hypothetical protein